MTCLNRKRPHVTLEQAKQRLEYDADTGEFYSKHLKKRAGCVRPDGYRQINLLGRAYLEANLAWWFHTGEWPDDGLSVDHADRDPQNNRASNLRLLTPQGQVHNREYKGYYVDKRRKKKYCVKVMRDGKCLYGGNFYTEEEAIRMADWLKS